jgi:hypothetical protein
MRARGVGPLTRRPRRANDGRMSFGNNGGNGFGGFPPPAQGFGGYPQPQGQPSQPQGPWGFPTPGQAPPGFVGGYRTPAGPGPEAADETWFEVEVPSAGAPVPNRCACCCGPVEARRAVSTTVTIGRTHYTRRMDIPYCRACDAAARGGARRGVVHGLLGLAVAGVFPLLLSLAWQYAPAAVTFVATPLVALGALALLAKLWKEEPIARHRGATSGSRDAVWMLPFQVGQNATRLAGTNEAWMRELASIHQRPITPRGKRPTRAARFIAVPILATLLAIPVWFGLHGRVYFDNPTMAELTFDIDHGLASITVPANGHDDVYLPVGHTVIDVMFNGRATDRIAGDIDPFGKHLASPLGQACYATITTVYGNAMLTGPRVLRAAPGLRWHTLEHIQDVLAPFPRSVSVGRGQRGATRRRFTRVDCLSGVPLR